MNLKSKTIVFSITLLSLSQVGLLYLLRARPAVAPVKTVTSNSDLAVSDPEESSQIATESADSGEQVKGGIVPHHLMVRDQLAAYFKAFDGANYDSVVIIGPNHFSRGDKIITTDRAWPTASGKELVPDISMINELGIEVQNEPFTQEHSIGNLVSFVKDAMPKAKIVPIILRIDTTQDEAANLAENLAKAVAGKKTLVLASVDFSHYQQVAVADLHDMASRAAIDNFELGRIYGLEIDSPPSIYALLKYLSLTGAEKGQLKFATNSGRLAPATADNTTSHNFYYFYPGKAKTEKYFSGLFFGDIMIDRHVGERIKSIKVDGLIKSLAGDEKRFLMGTDIVSANLEGAVTDAGAHYAPQLSNDFAFAPSNVQVFKQYGFNFFNMANNHLTDQGGVGLKETEKNLTALSLNHSGCPDKAVGDCTGVIEQYGNTKVAMLGFSMVYGDFDLAKAKEKVSEAKKQADFVVVNIHWGVEYKHDFSKKQQTVGHALIDAGADAIIGHHPHVTQGIEVYNNKPIFYSLGNFIFDQYFSKDTQEGFAVGLFVGNGTTTAHLFPLKEKKAIPELMKGREKEQFLFRLGEWSIGDALKKQVNSGVINF